MGKLVRPSPRASNVLLRPGRLTPKKTWRERTMRTLYNILFILFFWLSAPFYFLKMWRRGGWRDQFGQRFGRFNARVKHAVTNRHVIWFHAVSVGEVNLCVQLIRALEPRAPNLKVVVSTTTSTGMGELRKRLPAHILKIYYPIDFRGSTSRALRVIHPEAIVIVEAEIWPNFLWKARARRIPVFLVNARLSERSYRGYRLFGFLFRSLFKNFAGVGAQDKHDAERLVRLGCERDAVKILGSLKFDSARVDERRLLDVRALLRQLGVPDDAPILLGGSTHPGEEAILADLFLKLRPRFPRLFLLLVPRHFERGREVARVLEERSIRFMYRREITRHTHLAERSLDALVVNTTGELKYFYEEATVIFVGKSLAAEGGQNPIEPGALGKPMIFGPNMRNFATISAAFVDAGAAVQVSDKDELESAVAELLSDAPRRVALGERAMQVVKENTGALEQTVQMIIADLPPNATYVAPLARED